MRLWTDPLCTSVVEKLFAHLMAVPLPLLLVGTCRPFYSCSAAERDALIGRMPTFDRWGPLVKGTESREDNPYTLDSTKGATLAWTTQSPRAPLRARVPCRGDAGWW